MQIPQDHTNVESFRLEKNLQDHQRKPFTQTCQDHYETVSQNATSTLLFTTSRDGDSPTPQGSLFQYLTVFP